MFLVFGVSSYYFAHQVESLPPFWVEVVLQGRGPRVGVHHVAGLRVEVRDPAGKLRRVGQRGTEKDHASLSWEEDDGLLPHHPALAVLW